MRPLRELTVKVLANQPLEAAGEFFQRERAGSAQRPHRPKQNPARPLPLANLAQIFLASSGTAPRMGRLPEVCADMPVPLTGSAPLGHFPWA